jgi:hypothetical protein
MLQSSLQKDLLTARSFARRIQSAITSQQTVVIWPSNISEKDINDMVLAGHDVQSVVELNTYEGLEAQLNFNKWKRI